MKSRDVDVACSTDNFILHSSSHMNFNALLSDTQKPM